MKFNTYAFSAGFTKDIKVLKMATMATIHFNWSLKGIKTCECGADSTAGRHDSPEPLAYFSKQISGALPADTSPAPKRSRKT